MTKVAEIEVPGLPETIFIVPGGEAGRALMAKGIKRGRIWTNKEVEDLRAKHPTQADARVIAETKMVFDGQMVEPEQTNVVQDDDESKGMSHGKRKGRRRYA